MYEVLKMNGIYTSRLVFGGEKRGWVRLGWVGKFLTPYPIDKGTKVKRGEASDWYDTRVG